MSQSGLVKSWMQEKGCGYLTGHDGEEIFVHTSALCGGRLTVGGAVSFDVICARDGKKTATNVSGPGVVGGKMAAGKGGKGKGAKQKMSQSAIMTKPTLMGRGTGYIRMYNEDKAFGFVVQDGPGPDLFFHKKDLPKFLPCPHCKEVLIIPTKPPGPPSHAAIDLPPSTLVKGGKVTFKIEMQPDGKLQAVDVQGDGVGAPRKPGDDADDEELSLYKCDGCSAEFQACPGAFVKCPGCAAEIVLASEERPLASLTGPTEGKRAGDDRGRSRSRSRNRSQSRSYSRRRDRSRSR